MSYGVINVAPINDYNLLDTKISEFNVENVSNIFLISSLNYNDDLKNPLKK